MIKRSYFRGLALIFTVTSLPVYSATLWQNPEQKKVLDLSVTLRAKYQHTDYGVANPDQQLKFDAAILNLSYKSPTWFTTAEYRCYQYSTFCDFSTLVSAYAGYHLNVTDSISLGLQPIPFGPSRYWDSSFYASLNNTMGLQDVLNLGLNYHIEPTSTTQLDFGYFFRDGGSYQGSSQDAARYSANFIESSQPDQISLIEKNMLIARIKQKVNAPIPHLELSIGTSYWHSEIENKSNHQTGQRQAWSFFHELTYHDFNFTTTLGQLNIDHKDDMPFSTLGAFDSEYQIANEGYFYTIDTRYTFHDIAQSKLKVSPYLVLSGFNKEEASFLDSERNILGIAFNYSNTSLYTEYIMSKNDNFVGGDQYSLASGDDGKWNKLFNITLIHKF